MPWELPHFKLPGLTAGADLSNAQFFGVVGGDAGEVVVPGDGSGGRILGVLQNSPEEGYVAEITNKGVTKAYAGDAVAVYEEVEVTAEGDFIPVDTGTAVGIALEAAETDGDLFTLLLY